MFKIDIVNRNLQAKSVDLELAAKLLNGLIKWLNEFRHSGFSKCLSDAKAVGTVLEIDFGSGFLDKRSTRGRKRLRLEETSEDTIMSAEQKYEIEFFNAIVDNVTAEMNRRFGPIRKLSETFGFLWGVKLDTWSEIELEKYAKDLCLEFADDLEPSNFLNEIKFLKFQVKSFLPKEKTLTELGPLDVLNIFYQYGLYSSFSNVGIALRIFLTIPVTVASNERAFSKLKLIKNYLRSSMGYINERLTNLGIISIEHLLAESLDFDKIINDFTNLKCRKVMI